MIKPIRKNSHYLYILFMVGGIILSTSFSYIASRLYSDSSGTSVNNDVYVGSLKKKISQVGKLKFKSDVPIHYMKRSDFKEYLKSAIDSEYPQALQEKEEAFLLLMGFMDQKKNIRKLRSRILLNNISGLYNEKSKELVVPDECKEGDLFHSMVMIHELRHAVQDQHVGLGRLVGDFSAFDDRRMAVLAALEGDATILMLSCSDMSAEVLTSTSNADALFSFAPVVNPSYSSTSGEIPILVYQLTMPYLEGSRFVNAILKKRGQKGVNRLLSDPPDSTEQILHPEKYFQREKPIRVSIRYNPNNSILTGNEAAVMPGVKPGQFELLHSGVIGEYFLNVLLKSRGASVDIDFAEGWGGDFFEIFKYSALTGENPSFLLVWKSEWDNQRHCSNFFRVFKQFIEKHYNVVFKEGKTKTSVSSKSSQENSFFAGRSEGKEDYFFLTKTDKSIFYVRSDNRKQMNTFINGGIYD